MMLSFDQAAEALDKMAEEFPEPLFEGLSGGVNLLPDVQPDPELPDVYILGEYCDDLLGRYINLYYGSFAALADREDWMLDQWNDELRTTLSHGTGGLRSLRPRSSDRGGSACGAGAV